MTPDETIYIVEAEMNRASERVKKILRKAEMSEAEKIRVGEVTNFHKHIKRLIEVYNRDRSIAFGKIPPHDLDLERVVLGTLMLQCKKPEDPKLQMIHESVQKIKTFLQPEHFYSEVHGIIYKAVLSLEQPDGRSVHEHLRKEGLSELVGGLAYIAALTGLVVNALQETNARLLIEFAIKRKVIMIGANFMSEGYNDASDAIELLETADKEIKEAIAWIK